MWNSDDGHATTLDGIWTENFDQVVPDGSLVRSPYTAPRDSVASRSGYNVLEDRNVLTHISGTYDTYRCNTCDIVLSGYKRGDPDLHKHMRHGGGRCLYITIKFVGREHELTALQGRMRFQKGLMAFPEHLMYSIGGYVTLGAVKYCIICACPERDHDLESCLDMRNRLKKRLKDLKLPVPIDNIPLFGTTLDPGLECDGTLVDTRENNKFLVLGDSANMYYLEHTTDTHTCFKCTITVKDFVEKDTLLGEHIYHAYTQGKDCSYLIKRFQGNRCELMRILGEQRYRKGYVAFPDKVINLSSGSTVIEGVTRCCVCSVMVKRGVYAPAHAHFPQCNKMKNLLLIKLKDMLLLP